MTPRRSDSVFAPAKLNLFLHVLDRRSSDGLHSLQSLFVYLSMGDQLRFSPAAAFDLSMSPDLGVARADNLAWRALDAARGLAPDLPATHVTIRKHLPAEAGLGGGTANAAAVVHWAERLHPEIDFRTPLAALGADMPPAMDQTARLWSGTGDRPGTRVDGLAGTPVLLLKPPTGVATGACFAALQGQFGAPAPWPDDEAAPSGAELQHAIKAARNDLEAPACALNPDVAEALALLSGVEGAWLARMTGSGSTCFALFHENGPRDAALALVHRTRPTWWSGAADII